jgi:hypothetical protein
LLCNHVLPTDLASPASALRPPSLYEASVPATPHHVRIALAVAVDSARQSPQFDEIPVTVLSQIIKYLLSPEVHGMNGTRSGPELQVFVKEKQ